MGEKNSRTWLWKVNKLEEENKQMLQIQGTALAKDTSEGVLYALRIKYAFKDEMTEV